MDGDAQSDERERAARRREVLEGITLALDRWKSVCEVIELSDDEAEAARRVKDLLGVSDDVATEVLNIQWRRLTRHGYGELAEQLDSLRAYGDGTP